MFFVYVIENSNKKRYIGNTNNLCGRLAMHNDADPEKSRFHKSTYRKGPWKIIFYKEFETRRESLSFEKFLKTGNGRKWLKERARLGG